jgi:hypothetical protein
MRHAIGFCTALIVALAIAVPLGAAPAAASKAVKTMAGILATVNHFPTDDQKKTLTALENEPATTADEKVLIQALVTMQHSISAADKPKVEAIASDEKAPAETRSLAAILGRFLHMANADDKATLQKLAM